MALCSCEFISDWSRVRSESTLGPDPDRGPPFGNACCIGWVSPYEFLASIITQLAHSTVNHKSYSAGLSQQNKKHNKENSLYTIFLSPNKSLLLDSVGARLSRSSKLETRSGAQESSFNILKADARLFTVLCRLDGFVSF